MAIIILVNDNDIISLTILMMFQTIFFFPFFGQQSEKFKSELNSIFCKYFPEIKVFNVLANKRTIGYFFPYKNKLPLDHV